MSQPVDLITLGENLQSTRCIGHLLVIIKSVVESKEATSTSLRSQLQILRIILQSQDYLKVFSTTALATQHPLLNGFDSINQTSNSVFRSQLQQLCENYDDRCDGLYSICLVHALGTTLSKIDDDSLGSDILGRVSLCFLRPPNPTRRSAFNQYRLFPFSFCFERGL